MNIRPLSSALMLLSGLALTQQATAQDGGPERRRRYYDGNARPYYRGPIRFTLGGGVGLYSGDLTSGLGEQFVGPSFSAGLLYKVRPHWHVGGEASYVQLGAKDQLVERNLAFRGRNGSGVVLVRFEPFRDEAAFADPRRPAALVKPYIKAGVGFLLYSPKAYNGTMRPDDNTVFLPSERNDYPAMALVVPVGIGLTLRLTSQLNASIEGAYSFTTTDQLDDISPVSGRSSSDRNDGFGQVELKLEYAPWRR
ncbi:outer membrane beta-barrel protein [Hymenobacter glacieicola]|uniref:outer membrane beta-barrel protein n=1 Tax=Hymenobacter glacieicola TaxID=1562124 RepID=UPI00166D608D|nr:outer membrane beta-barrel protein [Hymenobacter glacieicola]